jgi:hypothetical protein
MSRANHTCKPAVLCAADHVLYNHTTLVHEETLRFLTHHFFATFMSPGI